ncbi:MAG: ATP-binding protein [Candidatus Saccharibacteria bacterium]
MAKVLPIKPFLILLYGFPGAGKTYLSRQLCEDIQAAHVQGDRIRAGLFDNPRYDKQENDIVTQLMDYMTEEFLSAGLSVVYDTNSLRASQRHALREMARRSHAQSLLIWLQIDPETAFSRGLKRDRRRADDKYSAQWDQPTFEKIGGYMQNPKPGEDYVVVSGKHLYTTQRSGVVNRLRDLGVLNLDDASSRIIKPGMVNLIPNVNTIGGRVDMSRRNIRIR